MTYNRKSRDAALLTTTTTEGYGITNVHCAPPSVRYARNKPVKFESYGEVFCQTTVKPKVSEVTSAKFSRRQDRQTSLHRSHSSSLLGKEEEEIKTEEIVPRRKRAEPVLYRRATEIMTKWESGPIVAYKYENDYDDSALLGIKKKTYKVEEDTMLRDYERRKAEKAKAAEREEERAAKAKEEKLALIRSTPSTPSASPIPKQLSIPSPIPKKPSTPSPTPASTAAPGTGLEQAPDEPAV